MMAFIYKMEHAQFVQPNVKLALMDRPVNYVLMGMLNKFYLWIQLEFKMLFWEISVLLVILIA